MDRLRLWGFSLIGGCVFKLAMTPWVGVRPEAVNLTITLVALASGGMLVCWSLAKCDQRGETSERWSEAEEKRSRS